MLYCGGQLRSLPILVSQCNTNSHQRMEQMRKSYLLYVLYINYLHHRLLRYYVAGCAMELFIGSFVAMFTDEQDLLLVCVKWLYKF